MEHKKADTEEKDSGREKKRRRTTEKGNDDVSLSGLKDL